MRPTTITLIIERYPQPLFSPTHWVDVTAYWEATEKAILAHTTQEPQRCMPTVNGQAGFRARDD
ncbi:hypothetical protein [Rhizobium sp. FKY42]|uniref:hypothetical protein n=1 Tax=Rhizobium sp. FKY42 TaxID=2562310 RepID=UPI001FEFFC54|nr:hypothetical protein [Rhizobium sp. FKY42]